MGWFLSSVVPDVCHQSSIINERFSTKLTDERSLTSVDPLVAPQGARPRIGFTTNVAGEGFDTGVTPHVSVDVLVGFATNVTDLSIISVEL